MNKTEFLNELKDGLSGLPREDVEERLSFYGEMIDDRVEEGMTEEEAVAGIGSVDEIASQIVSEIPLSRLVREKAKQRRRLSAWEIVLIIIGFPMWLPLLIAAAAVILSLYVVVWAIIISLWAVDLSLAVGAIGGIAAAVVYFINGNTLPALMTLGAALLLAGLSVFLFFGCLAISKGTVKLTKKELKSMFIRKRNAK